MELSIQGADFSTLGLGNTRWIENYRINANITNATQIAALRTLYNSMKSAGLDKKFAVFRLFFNGGDNNLGDILNVVNPYNNNASYRAIFNNDAAGAHSASGYTFSAANTRYISSPFVFTPAMTDFHMHVYNSTAESGSGRLLGAYVGGSLFLELSRTNGSDRPTGGISTPFNRVQPAGAYGVAGTGLLSITRTAAGLVKLYDQGAVIASSPSTPAPTGSAFFTEGNLNAGGNQITNCKVLFIGYGATTWTDADEVNLNSIISAFKTAIGA